MAAPIPGCAKISSSGKVTPLGPRPAPDVSVAAEDVQDPSRLAQFVSSIFREIASLKARWYPRRIDYEDVAVGNSGTVQLAHGFAGRVRWWVVDWQPTLAGKVPVLARDAATDANTLVLISAMGGVATIRVEEAG